MAGFGKVVLVGEYFNQKVVNVLWYRSTEWLPLQGNPFDDVLAIVDAVRSEVQNPLMACLPSDYTLHTVEGVGFADDFSLVTSSPLIRTAEEHGLMTNTPTMGAAGCAIISLRCGEQVQINGLGKSKRNRGYLAIGPIAETNVDNYSHLTSGMLSALDGFAQHLDNNITLLNPAITLEPIRVHEKFLRIGPIKQLEWRTYSDVLGYRVNNVASYRRSRQPEA